MAVTPRQFFDTNLTAPPSKLTMDRLRTAKLSTYDHRQNKVKAIQVEMQVMADTLAHLVQAEKAYHSRMSLFVEQNNSGDPYASTSAPEFALENRQVALANITYVDPREEILKAPVHHVSEPSTALTIEFIRTLLDDVDKNIRLYSHRVRSLRLMLGIKQTELERLNKEKGDTDNASQ